jgi:hypothetical protein
VDHERTVTPSPALRSGCWGMIGLGGAEFWLPLLIGPLCFEAAADGFGGRHVSELS